MVGDALMLPASVGAACDRLVASGHTAVLTGRSLRELLQGHRPPDFEVTSDAPLEVLLSIYPKAVVAAPLAARLTLPTADGPLDLRSYADDGTLERHLARRDFRIHAIARHTDTLRLVDPFDGRGDLAHGVLGTPIAAKDALAADPIRAVRAARIVAELGLAPDPDLESAMIELAPRLEHTGGRRVRLELEALLLAPDVRAGLALLLRTRLLRQLIPDVRADAPAVVSRLPRELVVRLAGLLRGARPRLAMRALRVPRDTAQRVEALLQRHPIDQGPASARELRARRLARRPEAERRALLALRAAELDAQQADDAARRAFERMGRSLARASEAEALERRRAALALDGGAVMAELGCGPGPLVGRALRYLADRIAEDPSHNEPETLRRLLRAWQHRQARGAR